MDKDDEDDNVTVVVEGVEGRGEIVGLKFERDILQRWRKEVVSS